MCLKEEDKNTRFFHMMADANRRRNHLFKLKINGEWFSEGVGLKELVVRAFQHLLYAMRSDTLVLMVCILRELSWLRCLCWKFFC